MEQITSRKNRIVSHLRLLAQDSSYRTERGEFLCDGLKMLREAESSGAEVTLVLWKEGGAAGETGCMQQYTAPADLFDSVSPLKNSPGPLFTVREPQPDSSVIVNALVLENVQDPGNVGTVIRTADAFSIGAVVLLGACADPFSPKTVRATMGAVFRQRILRMGTDAFEQWRRQNRLKLYGAVLSEEATEIRKVDISHAAVAVGNEGNGLSRTLTEMCDGRIMIPMFGGESLNAAVAASILMWEMIR